MNVDVIGNRTANRSVAAGRGRTNLRKQDRIARTIANHRQARHRPVARTENASWVRPFTPIIVTNHPVATVAAVTMIGRLSSHKWLSGIGVGGTQQRGDFARKRTEFARGIGGTPRHRNKLVALIACVGIQCGRSGAARGDFRESALLFKVGQQGYPETVNINAVNSVGTIASPVRLLPQVIFFVVRNFVVRVMEIVQCNAELLEIVGTLHSPCRFAGSLNRRQQKRNQNTDDGNNNKKLNERKSMTTTPYLAPPPPS